MYKNNNSTEAINRYKKETGKEALWRGVTTNNFKKWQKGETIHINNKKRINCLISKEKKYQWKNYAIINNFKTLSKLIHIAIDFYVAIMPKIGVINNFSKNIYLIKENLSSVKNFSYILIDEHKNELNWEALLKIKEIIDKSADLENTLENIINLNKNIENLN